MKTVVLKFGGSSLSSLEHIKNCAQLVMQQKQRYPYVAVVVSAMGNATDHLIQLAQALHPNPPKRELDMLITSGERISIALMAMALHQLGLDAVSFTGSQSGIITNADHAEAKIIDVRAHRVKETLEKKGVVIIAGFQGVSLQKEITSLGRGGSDTSAVALALALHADHVKFYKDVEGIYETDPKQNPKAKLYSHLSYTDVMQIAENGGVIHPRAILLASKNQLPLHLLSSQADSNHDGSWILGNAPRQMKVCFEESVEKLSQV